MTVQDLKTFLDARRVTLSHLAKKVGDLNHDRAQIYVQMAQLRDQIQRGETKLARMEKGT